jgi:hypothetical protein
MGKTIVFHGKNEVKMIDVEGKHRTALLTQVRTIFATDAEAKHFEIVGGTILAGTSDQYSELPLISVCSKSRHADNSTAFARGMKLDLHTSEAPIELTTSNANLTIADLRLSELAINNVLNIFAVQRKSTGRDTAGSGKDGIFGESDAWEHPVLQSRRGISMLLSSLRVFTHLINARQMEQACQDGVLHLFNLLTRFPPAVRAIHILMNGRSPRSSERAALSQAIYEILKDVVPPQIINSDPKRFMEGSRLLFGLILEKVKSLKLIDDAKMPYQSSIRVIDLRNSFTVRSTPSTHFSVPNL